MAEYFGPLPGSWKIATLKEAHMVAVNVKSLLFEVKGWEEHKAGQHYDIRLTAADGYQAERSYSVGSPPEQKGVAEFGVQLLTNGEVSPYLYELKPGDRIEVWGPIGGHFIWDTTLSGPLILIGGGSGMVPLMSMVRHWQQHAAEDPARDIVFLISARTEDHVLYREELRGLAEKYKNIKVVTTLTDAQPAGWTGYARRIDAEMFMEVFERFVNTGARAYICGPTPFVEKAADRLVDLGFPKEMVKTERFG